MDLRDNIDKLPELIHQTYVIHMIPTTFRRNIDVNYWQTWQIVRFDVTLTGIME